MTEPAAMTGPAWHRKLGVELYNHTWALIDKPDRTPEDDDAMLQAAYVSRYHWSQVGAPLNLARSEWQESHVYALLKRPEPALYHAARCLDICQAHRIGEFDLAFAHEALARAYAAAGDRANCARHLDAARAAGAQIAEEDDRAVFLDQLATVSC